MTTFARSGTHFHARRASGTLTSRLALALGTGSLVLGAASAASAQDLGGAFPFPSTNAAAGATTGAITTHELRQLYLDWRDALIERCDQGDARIRYPESNNDTRSEGVGYGMVIAAYMGDQPTFDGLWDYYKRQSNNGLMDWRRNGCGGDGEGGSASDADIDAALAVLVADKQFPGNGYAQEATQIIGAIRDQLFDGGCQGVLLAGSQFANCNCINPSYIPPGYYEAYGAVDDAAFWDQARNASYTYYNAVRDQQTGLVPAWSQANGNLQIGCNPQVAGGGSSNQYQADAARTPWRVAIDYQWTGDARAQDFLQSIGGFATRQELMRIRDSYTLQGQRANGDELSSIELGRNTYVMGGFATAMVALDQQQLDDFTGAWISVYKSGDNFGGTFRAFNNSLALLYGLLVTGTMWSPFGANPTAMPEATLTPPTAGNLLVNGDFDEGVTGWLTNSDYYTYDDAAQFTSSDGFALHQNGEMRLRVLRNEPAEPQRISFHQTVNLQAGQRYRLAVDARSAAPRALRAAVQGEDVTYGAISTGEDGTFTVDTQMRTFQTVFESPASDPAAEVIFQFGHSSEDVIIDNVILEVTTLPVDPGSAVGGDAPGPVTPVGQPGNPVGPGSGAGGSGDGTIGTVPNNPGTDATGAPVTPVGTTPPNTPGTGAPAAAPANPNAPSAQNCLPASFSSELGLCYDPATGLVYDPSQSDWTAPPPAQFCGLNENDPGNFYYWWPLVNACYDPESGTYWDERLQQWVFVGTNFEQGQRGVAKDSGCSVSSTAPANGSWAMLAFLGLAGAALARRRR